MTLVPHSESCKPQRAAAPSVFSVACAPSLSPSPERLLILGFASCRKKGRFTIRSLWSIFIRGGGDRSERDAKQILNICSTQRLLSRVIFKARAMTLARCSRQGPGWLGMRVGGGGSHHPQAGRDRRGADPPYVSDCQRSDMRWVATALPMAGALEWRRRCRPGR